MNKAKWLSTFIFAFFAVSDAQAIAINYPSKKMLQKADHILSLAMTAALCSTLIASKNEAEDLSISLIKLCFGVTGVNIVANALMLKHEKSASVALKILLLAIPFAGVTGFQMSPDESYMGRVALRVVILGFAGNGIKNIWDVYSLARSEQSEGIQHD